MHCMVVGRRAAAGASDTTGIDHGARQSQILKGVLDLCVLAVLRDGPQYGYGLVGALQGRGFELVAEGTVYPLLARMEKGGMVSSFKAPSPDGPRRKYYELTDTGRATLAAGIDAWTEVEAQVRRLLIDNPSNLSQSVQPFTEEPCQ